MSLLLGSVAAGMVVAAAVRSTWSPCGLSMLSVITPLAEAARGRRYRTTAMWFMAGALLGGTALGSLGALGATVVRSLDLTAQDRVAAALVALVIAIGFDADVISPRIPHHRRQVNEVWLDQFRGWVYGAGFGAQIGFGLATYIMTAAVYLVVVLGALGANPTGALLLGTLFGGVRGAAIFVAAGVTDAQRLMALHRRIDHLTEPSRIAMVVVELVAAALLAGTTTHPGVALGGLAVGLFATWLVGRSRKVVVLPSATPPSGAVDVREPTAATRRNHG